MMRTYGLWRFAEDVALCVVEVFSVPHSCNRQCSRKCGYGPKGEYCFQHAQMVEAGKYVYVPEEE